MDKTLFKQMTFKYPWRKYQRMVLDQFVDDSGNIKEKQLHIVAPPGSGKTILGIELIRAVGEPAVIFSPTSTIQAQWKDKVKLFLDESKSDLQGEIASTDPNRLKLINTFTYQLISTPAESKEFIEEVALKEWAYEITKLNLEESIEEADFKIDEIRKSNLELYTRTLAKYYKKAKDQLLRDDTVDIKEVIHKNAVKLIGDLVNAGVKTVIMDESHHLLDYWAFVLRALMREIEGVNLIGLTATPPVGVGSVEQENYYSIMGDVDFEVPTPAVVKEGNLSPYQDLVHFVFPTKREKEFIKNIQDHFEGYLNGMLDNSDFYNWFNAQDWSLHIEKNIPFAIAGMKYFLLKGMKPPKGLVFFEEAYKPIYLDDWIELLSVYAKDFLAVSEEPRHHKEYTEIKSILKDFGFTLTERGIRKHRSPADRVLGLSESKSLGAVKILRNEMSNLGTALRAVVITDFENESAYSRDNLEEVIDSRSGGAIFVFDKIVHDERTTRLEAVLVTGNRVLIDVDEKKIIITAMNQWKKEAGLDFKITVKKTEVETILEIIGSGKDWKSSTYVRMVTALFEKGVTKCIVGTRGLLSEGWDTLSLNTLIDLTTATTSTTVQQLRGRSLRIDPDTPEKVANNWDVVCIEPKFERGDQDFMRFIKKHSRFYGLGKNKKIVRGIAHVDETMFLKFNTNGFKSLFVMDINARMFGKAKDREKAYKEWDIGNEYQNVIFHSTQLEPKDIKFRTAFTFRNSLLSMFNSLLAFVGSIASIYWFISIQTGILTAGDRVIITALLFFTIIVGIFAGKRIYNFVNAAFIQLPVDSYIKDIAKALLTSLRESELVEASQSVDNIRVSFTDDGFLDVFLDYSNEKDTRTFSDGLNELFQPITNQRYLVKRSEADIKVGIYTPIWFTVRRLFGLFFEQEESTYHPVPYDLAVNKKRALNFQKNWARFVGGSGLVYTRSKDGVNKLLEQRSKKFNRIRGVELDLWK